MVNWSLTFVFGFLLFLLATAIGDQIADCRQRQWEPLDKLHIYLKVVYNYLPSTLKPRYSEFCVILNKTQLQFWGFAKQFTFDTVNYSIQWTKRVWQTCSLNQGLSVLLNSEIAYFISNSFFVSGFHRIQHSKKHKEETVQNTPHHISNVFSHGAKN